jgi:type II secretory pathway component GspD/PulD (secretin)
MVGNGETAVIGGLIRSNTTTLNRGVPILRSLPIIGGLFRGTSEVKEKRELLIFVTPRIISSFAANEN